MALLTVQFEIDDKVNEAAVRDMVQRFNGGDTGESGTLRFEYQEFDFKNIESMSLGPDDEDDEEEEEESEDEDDSSEQISAASPVLQA